MGRVLSLERVLSLGLAAIAAAAPSAHGELVSLSPSRDATIYEAFDGSIANGAGRYLFAGKNNQNRARRGLMHFDLAGILPPDAVITSARLTLNMSQAAGGPSAIRLHRALADWTTGSSNPEDPEGSGTTPAAGDATWLHTSADGLGGGTPWEVIGGDFESLTSASVVTAAIGLYTFESEQLLADVQAFAANPSLNFGWFILGDETGFGNARRFDSSEGGPLGGIAPTLVLEFATVPAPSAAVLLPLAALAHRRRRRS